MTTQAYGNGKNSYVYRNGKEVKGLSTGFYKRKTIFIINYAKASSIFKHYVFNNIITTYNNNNNNNNGK